MDRKFDKSRKFFYNNHYKTYSSGFMSVLICFCTFPLKPGLLLFLQVPNLPVLGLVLVLGLGLVLIAKTASQEIKRNWNWKSRMESPFVSSTSHVLLRYTTNLTHFHFSRTP